MISNREIAKTSLNANVEENHPLHSITNLVFEGGSVKGIAYIGALEALEKLGLHLSSIERVAGTSAGAITAALLGAGCSVKGIRDEMSALNFENFLDEKTGNTKDCFFAAVKQKTTSSSRTCASVSASISHPIASSQISSRASTAFGMYDGDTLRDEVERVLYERTGKHNITFGELHKKKIKELKKFFKDVFIAGVDLATGFTTAFNYLKTPDDIISDAVRISASIPFIFKPHVRYYKNYSKNKKGDREIFQPEHLYTDGGVLDNYPVGVFDFAGFVDPSIPEDAQAFWDATHNPNTLGFRLLSKSDLDYFTGDIEAQTTAITSLLSYTKALLQTICNKQNSDHVLRGDQPRSVYIDNQGIDTFAFNLTDQQKKQLIAAGEEGVNRFYARRESHLASQLQVQSRDITDNTTFDVDIKEVNSLQSITNLVFQGGSVKGIAYLGALEALEESGVHLSNIQRVAGTSAGAIIAALLGVGCSLFGVRTELFALDFKRLLDEKTGYTPGFFFNAVEQIPATSSRSCAVVNASASDIIPASQVSSRLSSDFGIYDGELLRREIERCLYERTGKHHITFGELHKKRIKKPEKFKDVFIAGVDLSTGCTTVFNYLKTPDDIISDAVRISASIPFLFKPHVRYCKINKKRTIFQPKHLYTDGGVLDNYPVGVFDFAGFVDPSIPKDAQAFWDATHNPNTLGFRLLSKNHIDYLIGEAEAPTKNITSLLSYTKALVQTIYKKQNSDHVQRGDQPRTVYIDNQEIDTFAFDLTDQQKERLVAAGREGVNEFCTREENQPATLLGRKM